MAISSNDNEIFDLSNIQDNDIFVYDASTGTFRNEASAVSANATITGQGRNIGSTGVGLYKQNDSQFLEFYKIDSGSNVTLSLNDNVLTIDAVVGTSNTTIVAEKGVINNYKLISYTAPSSRGTRAISGSIVLWFHPHTSFFWI